MLEGLLHGIGLLLALRLATQDSLGLTKGMSNGRSDQAQCRQ